MAKTTKKPAAKKAAKKPTAKQLAARKKFAAMAKAKAKAVKAKKPAAKKVAAKKTASKAYQTGSSNKLYDSMKKAQGPGKRVSKGGVNQYNYNKPATERGGNVYYERRKNRSDMPGSILGIGALKKSAISDCTAKLGTLHAKKLMEPTKRGKAKLQKEITAVNKKIKQLGKL
jgi:upstream activation factor subunit UAF30